MTEPKKPEIAAVPPRVYASFEDVVAPEAMPVEDVFVDEWSRWVKLKGMSAGKRDAWEDSNSETTEEGGRRLSLIDVRAKLLIQSMIDEKGNLLLKPASADPGTWEDTAVSILSQKSSAAISRLFRVATRLSGLSAETIKRIERNLETTPGGGSDSSSPKH